MISDNSKHFLREIYSAQEVEARVDLLASQINSRFQGEELLAVCVLKGAFMFFSDIVKRLNMPVQTDFVRLSSYGAFVESSRNVKLTKDVENKLTGRNVLIVEDIVDTGHSMNYLLHEFKRRSPKSLALAALIDKPERREVAIEMNFVGFSDIDGFLVGYGLDFAENYRNFPAIYELLFKAD